MGYAKYIGRVGALAVTLGVGVAIASTPGVAYAQPAGSSSSTSESSSTDTSTSTGTSSVGGDTASTDGSDGTDASAPDVESPSGSTDESPADDDGEDVADVGEDAEEGDGPEEPTDAEGDGETPPAAGDEETPPVDPEAEDDDGSVEDSANADSDDQQVSGGDGAGAVSLTDTDDVESSLTATAGQPTESDDEQAQLRTTSVVTDDPAQYSFANSSADALTTTASTFRTAATTTSTPVASPPRPTLVSIVTDIVAAVLRPLMSLGTGSPIQTPLLWTMLAAARNEFERGLARGTATAAPRYTVTQLDPTPNSVPSDATPNVLVIGVDGTNLSRILADDNQNFFDLMDDGTTAASSIVGHTTISNPSWTAILTGAWGERTGVINNVFTPWTYDKWPTVFNQLETQNPGIETTSIANWNVISAIAGAGSIPVDENIYIPQIEGDTNWLETDDAVGEATVDAIENTPTGTPSFLFSYFVGVDENGHMYGGASEQYKLAIENVDENLGDIMTAVEAWETAHPTEGEWTIIVVTDHGHQPQVGFGHGFQSPDETATFVIASGPNFNNGFVNPDYEIVDTTPTVLTIFGITPPGNSDGVSLTTLGGSDEDPGDSLHQALEEMIATNHSPDIVTDVALGLRTIFATVPYYVYTFIQDGALPIPILGDILYVATNIPAQIVARLTGVTGASIFPLLPPPPPSWPGQEEATVPDVTVLACGGGESGSAAELCDAGIVA